MSEWMNDWIFFLYKNEHKCNVKTDTERTTVRKEDLLFLFNSLSVT